MKKTLALLLALLMLLALTACGEDEEGTPTGEGMTAGTSPSETEASHTHSYSSEVTTAATCNADGVTTFTCTCGDTYTEVIAATDHTWGSWDVETYALLGKPGTEKRTCSACGETETQERTENAVANSFYDGGLQYIFITSGGQFTGNALLEYARHEFHDYLYEATPSATIFAELSKHFYVTDALKADMIKIGTDEAAWLEQNGGFEGNYGYNKENDTFTLQYNAEPGEFSFLGYVHNEGNKYTIYCSRADFGFEVMPETLWKVELEYNKIDGNPNRYLSAEKVDTVPSDMIACPEGEFSEYYR